MACAEVLHPIIASDQYFTSAFSNMLIKICSWLYSQFFLKQSEKKYISDVNKAQERFISSLFFFSFSLISKTKHCIIKASWSQLTIHLVQHSYTPLHTLTLAPIYLLPPQLFPSHLWPQLSQTRMKEITQNKLFLRCISLVNSLYQMLPPMKLNNKYQDLEGKSGVFFLGRNAI